MKRFNSSINKQTKKTNSQPYRRGRQELWQGRDDVGGTQTSRQPAQPGRRQCHCHSPPPHVCILKKVDASGRGGCSGALPLCNRSRRDSTDAPPPSEEKMEWHKAPELKHATWCSPLLPSPPPPPSAPPHPPPPIPISLLPQSLSCSRQAARGYPIGSLRVVAVSSHLFTLQPVSQPSLSYPRAECVPCQFC